MFPGVKMPSGDADLTSLGTARLGMNRKRRLSTSRSRVSVEAPISIVPACPFTRIGNWTSTLRLVASSVRSWWKMLPLWMKLSHRKTPLDSR